jgi:LmbE family N-acetylglucosaminyl deacetylase
VNYLENRPRALAAQQLYKDCLMPSLRLDAPPASVLVVAAHPDDIEFYAGGTLAAWISAGATVHYLLVTDGAAGSRDPNVTTAELAQQRRREQRAAAQTLGVSSVTFLGYPDAGFDANLELRLAIARVIRQTRPEVVLTFDPTRYYHANGINHPDHLAVGASTLGAVMPLANTLLAAPSLMAEGLEPHDVSAVYLFETATPTHWMPLEEADVSRKLAAMGKHTSQLELWDGVGAARDHGVQLAQMAQLQGVPCAQAEGFTCVRLSAPAPVRLELPLTQRQPVQYSLQAL